MQWLGGRPFIQIGRHAIINERAIELTTHHGNRLYRVQLRDRPGTDITASRTGGVRLAAVLKSVAKPTPLRSIGERLLL
jgi:DNA-binding LytR/AlgR family response regulator